MKNVYSLIEVLLFVFSIDAKAQIEDLKVDSTFQKDSLYVEFVGVINDEFVFEIVNNTKDSLYLFDSYLFDNEKRIISTYDGRVIQSSKYLHRYDKKTRQCKLSFLPLLPYLTAKYSDRPLVVGENKVAYHGQVLYNFSLISPQSRLQIAICKEAIYQETYVKEIYPKKHSKFENRIKFSKDLYPKCENIVAEFAVYKNVNLLTSHESFLYDEYNFNKQGLSYMILSIIVNLHSNKKK